MSDALTYGVMDRERETDAVARLISLAFATTIDGAKEWMTKAGPEHFRVGREGDAPVACLLRIPMGQYFGGRSVPMVGIAGVAVAPEARGRGVAKSLMSHCMREIAAEGTALSCLYASTQSLYRLVGFEQAGHRFQTRLPWSVIAGQGEFVPVRALTDADTPAVEACYREFARRFNGNLDRGPYIWNRVRSSRDDAYHGFGIQGPRGIEGYLFVSLKRRPDTGRQDVTLSDLAFVNARAGRGLLRFLADTTTMAEEISFFGGPLHPLLTLMPQQRYAVERRDYWMLRLTDVRSAIASRGYGPAVGGDVAIELTDEVVPANAGPWTIRVRDGRGAMERGGSPRARMDVRGLAAMYAGLYSGDQAELLGLAEGDAVALATLGGLFGNATPWMTEMF
jgi:predicted acetyltransferase